MKRLIKAILWIVCYGGTSWFAIKTKLGFNILSGQHWKLLFDKSVTARWPMDMAPKKLVCKILLAFIIIGILGLSVVIKKRKTRIPVVKGELPQKQSERPALMSSQGRMISSTQLPIAAPSATGGNSTQSSMNSAPSGNLMGDAIRKITDIANDFDITTFPHVKLENTFTHLIVSDDSTALLLKILPRAGTWQVTQADLPEESLWSLQGEEPRNILKDIIESTATLARLEPEAQAVAVVLLTDGNIENAAEVKNYLNQKGIRIAVLDNQNMPDIPTWRNLLSEFYPQKQKENSDETDNIS